MASFSTAVAPPVYHLVPYDSPRSSVDIFASGTATTTNVFVAIGADSWKAVSLRDALLGSLGGERVTSTSEIAGDLFESRN